MGKMQEKSEKIRQRLRKSFLTVTLLLSCGSIIALISMFTMSMSYDSAMQNYGFSQGDIGKALTSLSETRSALRGAIGYDDKSMVDELISVYERQKTAFEGHLAEIEKAMITPEGHAAYDAIVKSLEGYWELSDSILEQGSVEDEIANSQAQSRAINELQGRYMQVYTALDELMAVNVEKGDETQSFMSILKFVITIAMIVFITAGMVVSLKIGSKIATGIEKPLEELGVRLNAFTHGDLGSPFPEIQTKDEIADIVNDCRAMATNLNEIISDADYLLREMASGNFAVKTKKEEKYEGDFNHLLMAMRKLNSQLNSTLQQIDEASDQVTEGAGQLAKGAQELAEGATDQAGAVEELTATIENVTAISEESAENAETAAIGASQAAQNANKSRKDMEELVAAMERITHTSKEIENIINAIEDIASQTNLLSLNASIEAARAGDAGRGFAVVADQIGKLAADSAQSAVSTKELIGKSLDEINKGNQIVEATMITIGDVLASMEEFAEVVSNSAQASRSQSNMLKQVEEGIDQIAAVVQNNSASSQQTSAISEQLSAQAVSLKEMVGKFTLIRK